MVNCSRSLVAETARFLIWLREVGSSPGDATQAHVDLWVAQGGKNRFRIRDFVLWAGARGAMRHLEVPVLQGGQAPTQAADARARIATARRLLGDGSIDPADRVVGALVVIYAQPVSRIARLKLSDVTKSEGDLFLTFGNDSVLMPEPLAGFLKALPWRRQVGIAGRARASDWLFPGRQAGRPQHPEYLRVRMRRLGIACRASRRAALIDLARQLPPSVVADMLNIHPTTAVKWMQWAGGSWMNYGALRLHDAQANNAKG